MVADGPAAVATTTNGARGDSEPIVTVEPLLSLARLSSAVISSLVSANSSDIVCWCSDNECRIGFLVHAELSLLPVEFSARMTSSVSEGAATVDSVLALVACCAVSEEAAALSP